MQRDIWLRKENTEQSNEDSICTGSAYYVVAYHYISVCVHCSDYLNKA